MIRFLLIACVIAIGCDRADELLAPAIRAGIEAITEEPPKKPTGHAADCAKGADRYAAPNVQLTIDCRPMRRDASAEWVAR